MNRRPLCLTLLTLLAASVASGAAENAPPPPPPYVFNLGGLTRDQVERLKKVPGVRELTRHGKRVRVVWQPYDIKKWGRDSTWMKGSGAIYEFLVLKEPIGRTQWTHGGIVNGRCGTIIRQERWQISFGMMFTDRSTGRNEAMVLHCFSRALPRQVEHEMLRGVPGTNVTVEKCGDGYVIVSRAGRGTFVVWQVSDQMFVRIDNSYDKEMVAAYVDRLGSIVPKDYKVDLDRWVEDEIRWRLSRIDAAHLKRARGEKKKSFAWYEITYLQMDFPRLPRMKSKYLPLDCTLQQEWEHIDFLRKWLWANRKNFRYDDGVRGYVLEGPDLYDPERPPELPDEIKGPPRPEAEK